ncbi:Hypothetical_protein [Hexamita inflata]|uniref:Hypothetical_protein n=1 Tax=Hexamita inflata TaxID=28002 RepID=A0ABP1HWL3_9EUKA
MSGWQFLSCEVVELMRGMIVILGAQRAQLVQSALKEGGKQLEPTGQTWLVSLRDYTSLLQHFSSENLPCSKLEGRSHLPVVDSLRMLNSVDGPTARSKTETLSYSSFSVVRFVKSLFEQIFQIQRFTMRIDWFCQHKTVKKLYIQLFIISRKIQFPFHIQ